MIERTKVMHSKSQINRPRNNSLSGKPTFKKPYNMSINQAIINLHDDLHQIKM